MRSIAGCETVTLPYWDETDSASLSAGIPWALTVETVELDGKPIPNPLRSFVFPVTITDNVSTDEGLYTKASGYETVRFPFSGLVGTDAAKKASEQHNSQWTAAQGVRAAEPEHRELVDAAHREHPAGWHQSFRPRSRRCPSTVHRLSERAELHGVLEHHVDAAVERAARYRGRRAGSAAQQHPSRGGRIRRDNGRSGKRRIPYRRRQRRHGRKRHSRRSIPSSTFITQTSTAMFWLWQQKWGKTDALDIIAGYPGTNSSDNQGSTPRRTAEHLVRLSRRR